MLSMKAKYAIRALMVLSEAKGSMLSSPTISKASNVPHKFLDAILQELRAAGFINSKRGIFGGYYLAKPPSEIIMGDVLRLIDGPLALIRCASVTAYLKCDDCPDEDICQIRKLMLEVRNAVAGVLDHRTLSDLKTSDIVQFVA
jgi:Rrf2 family protein